MLPLPLILLPVIIGTIAPPPITITGEEVVWNAGGGGFSNTFPIPAYQQEAVDAYMKNAQGSLPPKRYWNFTGRAYPDVSALAGLTNPYCVSYGGAHSTFVGVGGTSASSPVVAGLFALLNNIRLAQGKPSLGFVNPLIYQSPHAFYDVIKGVNDGGYGIGFSATSGWDPASGMGTPNFEELRKVVMNL